MKILYIGVFSHEGWGAEYWLSKAFLYMGLKIDFFDYRQERKTKSSYEINLIIEKKSKRCDLIFLQRGDRLSPDIFKNIDIPIIFWSTEPIRLKKDVDKLLKSELFSWVYVHSYSCLSRIQTEFTHLIKKTSVLHNAAPKEIFKFDSQKTKFAVFNRHLSLRRRLWLRPSGNLIVRIKGRYGQDYFSDLRSAQIAVNIHYSNRNLDDFESGIFEAMASGCAIVSERLFDKTLADLDLKRAIIQIDSPKELKEKLQLLHADKKLLKEYQEKSISAIQHNTWHDRARQLKEKFEEICYQQ